MDAIVDASTLQRIEKKARPASLRKTVKRSLMGLVAAGCLIAAACYGFSYWTVGQYLQSTDDAYVKADFTIVAPKVSGYVAQVLVEDNAHVKAGQVVAHIDDRDFRAALDQASADVGAAEAALRNIDAQTGLQRSVIDQQSANIAASEATLKFAREEDTRYQALLKSGFGTSQRAQEAAAALGEKEAQLQRERAALVAAEKAVEVLATERGKAEAARDRSRAALRQARLNLSYTTVTAPVDGTVGARSLRVGQYVQAGTQLMAVVPLHAVYVVANFKETQLTFVRSGQPVDIAVDGFPSVMLKGHVDSLSPASGLEFALLPPDNATGNFTKIVQRIPVKIAIDDGLLVGLLRTGMSVEPTIDTKSAIVAERDALDDGRRLIVSR
ncbi:MAG: HlyD family secretion protein [Mesorhizobium sp.]|uniref:HlyD family secretion protein n=1 Tax=Mesorhizobium sp. TaxID=1871066 RepID=UPI0011F7A0EC|nr:HlyD family secretion protein [Mesorhizobium sp.]TIQ38036.1 MAG: HlyD family secretion protein [Mesorhizobium sp.]